MADVPVYPESRVWLSCSAALANRGRLDSAAVCAHRCLNLTPGDAEVLTHLGSIQYRMKRYEEAADLLRKARKADPNYSANANILAMVKLTLGDASEFQSKVNEIIARGAAAGPLRQPPQWADAPAPARRKRGAPFLQQRTEKLYLEITAKPALMWRQPVEVWRGLALTNIRAAAALKHGRDLPYPLVRHVLEGLCGYFNLDRPIDTNDLPAMIEIARRTDAGMRRNRAAKDLAEQTEPNARLSNAVYNRLRKNFGVHEHVYRMIAASGDIGAAIDRLMVELERWSIQELDFAAVFEVFSREHR